MANPAYYFDFLYPLQNKVLGICRLVESDFYLTGGTAASRGYLNHRFSDDLDFFVNDDQRFGLWVERMIQALNREPVWQLQVLLKEERYCRMNIVSGELNLKLEWVNDVPAHAGGVQEHPVLGRLDSAQNILANKITALLDREEPKDLADIWAFCYQMDLSLQHAIEDAGSKAAGVFPADLARLLCSATQRDWELVRWVQPPDAATYLDQLNTLGEKLILLR